jgi:hypothetical protein
MWRNSPVQNSAKWQDSAMWDLSFSKPLTDSLRRNAEVFANTYLSHMAADFFFELVVHFVSCLVVLGDWRISFKTFGSNKNQTNSSDEL